jgi:uncharacterized membrane protein
MTAARRRASAWLAAATVVAFAWSALILLAPAWLATRTGDNALTPRVTAAGATYLVASRVCHQRPDRSFHLHGRALPVCGRCTGLYLSGTIGLLAGVAVRRRARPAARGSARLPASLDSRVIWLAVAALPTALTWSTEMLGLWNPGTTLRAITAIPLGLAAGVLVAGRRR